MRAYLLVVVYYVTRIESSDSDWVEFSFVGFGKHTFEMLADKLSGGTYTKISDRTYLFSSNSTLKLRVRGNSWSMDNVEGKFIVSLKSGLIIAEIRYSMPFFRSNTLEIINDIPGVEFICTHYPKEYPRDNGLGKIRIECCKVRRGVYSCSKPRLSGKDTKRITNQGYI